MKKALFSLLFIINFILVLAQPRNFTYEDANAKIVYSGTVVNGQLTAI